MSIKIGISRQKLLVYLPDIPTGQYDYYSDGTAIWRKGIRGGAYCIDKALTPMGFDGVENVDWVNVETLMA